MQITPATATTTGDNHRMCRKFSASRLYRGFRAQRFYLNLLPVLGFLYHSKDLDEPDKPVTSVFSNFATHEKL